MRRADRAIPENEARLLLQNGEFGVLSTVSADGQPYGVPVSYCSTADAIYFHSALDGHKLENIRGNNKVSFCVVGRTEVLPEKFSTKFESVIVSGTAGEAVGDEKQRALVMLLEKYSAGFIEAGWEYIEKSGDKTRVYKIQIESVTGKARR